MSFFRRSPQTPGAADPATAALPEAEALRIAKKARQDGDWPAALIALDQLPAAHRLSPEFHEARAWALEAAGRPEAGATTDAPCSRFAGEPLDLSPFDLTALMELVEDVRPGAILESGTRGAGLAFWLSAITSGLALDTTVGSADWICTHESKRPLLSFRGGDLRKPGSIWSRSELAALPHPWLLVVRAGGAYEITWSILRAWHKLLTAGDCVCVLADSDEPGDPWQRRTSQDALARFVMRQPVEYRLVEPSIGSGSGTNATRVRIARRTPMGAMDDPASPGLASIRERIERGEWQEALQELNALKASREPRRGVDYLRSLCFLQEKELHSACEAAKEECRYHPDHQYAERVVTVLLDLLFPDTLPFGGAEFHEIRRVVRRYTMVSDARLYSLYARTRMVCELDVPGDLVECGVAAGGGSAMIAATMMRHTKRPRRLYSCDTFEGMPTPTDRDLARHVDAEASGWGSGTCAAPPGSLLEVCSKLGVQDLVEPVQGLFADTLPTLRNRLPDGIAFLHMDSDWYESTRDILVNLYDKVQFAGFIQVDDYGHWEGCRQAMQDYATERGFAFQVEPIDYSGVWLQRPDRSATDRMLLHVGSAGHVPDAWVKLSRTKVDEKSIVHDYVTEPLPFAPATCRMVYLDRVLDDIPGPESARLMSDSFKVLAPGGLVRVSVSDREQLTRDYLRQLDSTDPGPSRADVVAHTATHDRKTLTRLLTAAGFAHVSAVDATASSLPYFAAYGIDADDAGRVRIPGVLCMEALKPS